MRFVDGYTLIELLVVITIMGILALIGFFNLNSFSRDQITIKAIGQVQSLLRLAQSNATSSVLCNGEGVVSWSVRLNAQIIDLICNTTTVYRSYPIDNATVSIKCSPDADFFLNLPVTITYSPLAGQVNFTGMMGDTCITSTTSLFISVVNSQNTLVSKSLTIFKGGAINVQ